MQKKETLYSIYTPPTASLPFLSVIFNAGRKCDPLVTSFLTAADAEAFNHDMRIELDQARSWGKLKDASILVINSDQTRAARKLLQWSHERLSEVAGVSIKSLKRFELDDGIVKPSTVAALRSAFEFAGVKFTTMKGTCKGVRMRKI